MAEHPVREREQQYEFNVAELGEYLTGKEAQALMIHSGGDGTVKVNSVSDVLITSSWEETINQLKEGRLSVGTFYIKEGCLIRQRKRWLTPTPA